MKKIIKKLLLKYTTPKINGISADYVAQEITNEIEELLEKEEEETRLWAFEAEEAKTRAFESSRGV